MKNQNKRKYFFISVGVLLFVFAVFIYQKKTLFCSDCHTMNTKKLYWFIPDGFRSNYDEFNIFAWAQSGNMPNLKKMLDVGCHGYSWPVFPGHTPVNFATLMTGVYPKTHGVFDATMRLPGYPLEPIVTNGFYSNNKLVPAIWMSAEKNGKKVALQSVPGSMPSQLKEGVTIRGRWGGAVSDFTSLILQSPTTVEMDKEIRDNSDVFYKYQKITKLVTSKQPANWSEEFYSLVSTNKYKEVDTNFWGLNLYFLIGDQEAIISKDKKSQLAKLKQGMWSEWINSDLIWEIKRNHQKDFPNKSLFERKLSSISINTRIKVKLIYLKNSDNFRIKIIADNLNEYSISPSKYSDLFYKKIGPMVDFADNYPPQLVYFSEDKKTFLEESDMSWDWHKSAVPILIHDLNSDMVVHNAYTSNQMLTSYWWLPYLDKSSFKYNQVNEMQRKKLWSEVKDMYKRADDVLGAVLKNTDQEWVVVLSSDHGNIPLNREVRLNNFFNKLGWLKYKKRRDGSLAVDFSKTKVFFGREAHIYINPDNLSGQFKHGSGEEYLNFREKVRQKLLDLKDPETGKNIITHVLKYEEAENLELPSKRVGDLIVSSTPGYYLLEEVISDGITVLGSSRMGGYKQAIWPKSVEGLLTPFVIMGPGVKKGCKIEKPINHVDQFATIAKILGLKTPYQQEGNVIEEILENRE